jgi:hypothetical protein
VSFGIVDKFKISVILLIGGLSKAHFFGAGRPANPEDHKAVLPRKLPPCRPGQFFSIIRISPPCTASHSNFDSLEMMGFKNPICFFVGHRLCQTGV